MNAAAKSPQEKRNEFLIQHRDKHLSQFMEINGKAVFAAILPIFTVLLAVDDVQGKFRDGGIAFWVVVGFAVMGIALLFFGALMLSTFHTHAIRSIQNRL